MFQLSQMMSSSISPDGAAAVSRIVSCVFGLKGQFLSAQVSRRPGGFGKNVDSTPTGSFNICTQTATNGPFRAELANSHDFPGLRPGLTDTALQAENPSRRWG